MCEIGTAAVEREWDSDLDAVQRTIRMRVKLTGESKTDEMKSKIRT